MRTSIKIFSIELLEIIASIINYLKISNSILQKIIGILLLIGINFILCSIISFLFPISVFFVSFYIGYKILKNFDFYINKDKNENDPNYIPDGKHPQDY